MRALDALFEQVRWSGEIDEAGMLAARKAVYGDDGAIARGELVPVRDRRGG